MQLSGFAGLSCRLKINSVNGLHILSTISTINPQTPYRQRWARNDFKEGSLS